jgi:hypothetical protein
MSYASDFVEVPSNSGLGNKALFGSGTLVMDIAMQRATFNRCPISPLPYSHDAQRWLYSQMQKRKIPIEELVRASLIVEYLVEMGRRSGMPYPTAKKIRFFVRRGNCVTGSTLSVYTESPKNMGIGRHMKTFPHNS